MFVSSRSSSGHGGGHSGGLFVVASSSGHGHGLFVATRSSHGGGGFPEAPAVNETAASVSMRAQSAHLKVVIPPCPLY